MLSSQSPLSCEHGAYLTVLSSPALPNCSGFAGNITVNVTYSDGVNNTTAPVTISVTGAAPPAPVAGSNAFTCPIGAPCVVAAPGVLANSNSSTPGTVLKVVGSTAPSVGSLALQPNGSFVYNPPA